MIRVLVFDLDDTLFPEHEFVRSGFAAVGAWLERNQGIAGFGKRACAEFDRGVRGDIFNRALRSLGVPEEPELVRQMVQVYRDHEPRISLFPDAEWALDHFAGSFRLALLTDGYLRSQQRKVAALGIAHRFPAIVFSDTFGREGWKPSPLPYRQVAEQLACHPSQCAYVADNPAKDFITAKKLSWFTVRVRHPGGEHSTVTLDQVHEAHVEVQTLMDLSRVLQRHVLPSALQDPVLEIQPNSRAGRNLGSPRKGGELLLP
jgi:putative hydrolase of the HAD superfamily